MEQAASTTIIPIHPNAEGSAARAASGSATDFWPSLLMAVALTSIAIGITWDISWHETVGRDTFWTPAHMAIYIGGVLGGCVGGWLAFKHTFLAGPAERDSSVSVFGARAPLGAWVAIWGALAMVTSAPFDDWWHNAYGLDVKIVSPPHMLLAAGIAAIQCGAMLMALAWQNRAAGDRRHLAKLFLLGAGLLLLLVATVAIEHTQRWDMHQAHFYQVSVAVFLFFILSAARASVCLLYTSDAADERSSVDLGG